MVSSAVYEVAASSVAHVAVSSVAHVVATSVVHEVVASPVIAASETLYVAPTYHEAVASTSAAAAVASGEATVNTHVIQVGGPAGELIFAPNNIVAAPGDLVQFQFNPKNHSVVQSTFDNPCIPIQNILANKTDAFFSGFMPVSAAAGNATGKVDTLTYTIRVMDSKPVWFYCSQGKHCQSGMVGAINAPATGNKTMEGFTALAAVALENLSPGQASGGSPAVSSVAPGAPQSSGFVASATVSGAASTTTSTGPLQNSVAAAPGNLARQSFFGLGLGGLAAFLIL
ncbi:hypothetical protein P154DRAFT_444928 [Amniculicola lignicola CBS 123094]|uniref:Cupredoxin n=1 Tax=Amniculicola lignicola CBS 123094 TaxID=1392246 RepID=A0A6A5W1T0_9PLEO|nr:hypothetical protein P154DRAFT_444928 [Amniculicola lignicola CBS 123094]